MLTYKDVCGNDSRVWFELGKRRKDVVSFLKWAKSIGCIWLSGEQIQPRNGTGAHYISIHDDGRIACVGMWSWLAYHHKKEADRPRVISFEEFKTMLDKFDKQLFQEVQMNGFWQRVFAQSQKQLVFFKEVVGKHEYGTDCVIHAMDHSFKTCAVFENLDEVGRCPHARGFVKLAFKCDYDYMFPQYLWMKTSLWRRD